MSAKPDAWFPMYPGDYLRDTGRLTTEQHGAYFLLLLDYYVNGPPPDDDSTLAAITRMAPQAWRKARPSLQGFFTIQDSRWHQKRADGEMAKSQDITAEKSAAGKLGAAKRWQKHGTANGKQDGKPIAEPSPEMAKGMAGAWQTPWQNDAQPHPQSQSIGEKTPDPDTPRANSVPTEQRETRDFPGTPVDFQKEIWARGPAFLKAFCIDEKRSKSLIGRWIKALNPDGDVKLLKLLAQAEASAHGDPIAYIEAAIRNRSKSNGNRPTAEDRDRQRRSDVFEGVAAVFPGLRRADSGEPQAPDPGSDPGREIAAVAGKA